MAKSNLRLHLFGQLITFHPLVEDSGIKSKNVMSLSIY